MKKQSVLSLEERNGDLAADIGAEAQDIRRLRPCLDVGSLLDLLKIASND